VIATVGMSTPAYAAGSTATTLTVTPSKTLINSGQALTFLAAVAPNKVDTVKATGTVDWTVRSATGAAVPCTTVTPLSLGGKSKCTIAKGILLAGDAPFTASATYSGDATFAGSSATATVDGTSSKTAVKMVLDAKPVSGASTTVTVTVSDGPATTLVSGTVIFTISSTYHSTGTTRCTGSLTPVSANNVKPVVAQQAVCVIPAGWFKVPSPSSTNPKPRGSWSISATYNGNSSFLPSYKTMQGSVAG